VLSAISKRVHNQTASKNSRSRGIGSSDIVIIYIDGDITISALTRFADARSYPRDTRLQTGISLQVDQELS